MIFTTQSKLNLFLNVLAQSKYGSINVYKDNKSIFSFKGELPGPDANIKIFCPETHTNIHVDNDQVEVTLSNGEKIYSKLLVGADGARSSIRDQFSFGVNSKQYDQSCLVANACVVNNSQNITWQRFTPSGPQAYLPLDDNTGSIVWYDSAEAIQSYVDLSNEDLSKKIMREFPREIGKVIILSLIHI